MTAFDSWLESVYDEVAETEERCVEICHNEETDDPSGCIEQCLEHPEDHDRSEEMADRANDERSLDNA